MLFLIRKKLIANLSLLIPPPYFGYLDVVASFSVVDPNTLNLDPDPGFLLNLDPGPDPGLYYQL